MEGDFALANKSDTLSNREMHISNSRSRSEIHWLKGSISKTSFNLVSEKVTIFVSMSEREFIHSFSEYLFWDVDKDSIDLEANAPYVVRRVLELGQLNDWNLLKSWYGIQKIASIAQNLRTLEPKAPSFISAVSSLPKESIRCFTTRPSTPTHWSYYGRSNL